MDSRRVLDATRSLGPFILLVFFIISVGIFSLIGTQAGKIYFTITIIAVILVNVLFMFFIKENESRDFEFPFSKTFLQFCVWLWLGILIVPLFNLISGAFFNLKLHQIWKPFATFSATDVAATFTVIKTEFNPFVNSFNTIFGAGVGETFLFNLMAVVIGVSIAIVLLKVLEQSGMDFSDKGRTVFKFVVGVLLIPILFFVMAHLFNADYVGQPTLFLFAALFLLLTNVGVYYLNVGIALAMGLHMANNMAALGWGYSFNNLLIPQAGALSFLQFTVWGFFLITLVFIVIALFRRPKSVVETITNVDVGI